MVTWSMAFRNSVIFCVYYCIWAIIGGGVMFVGMFFGLMMIDPYNSSSFISASFILLGAYVVGGLICFFGAIASMIKVAGDAAEESIGGGGQRRAPSQRRY